MILLTTIIDHLHRIAEECIGVSKFVAEKISKLDPNYDRGRDKLLMWGSINDVCQGKTGTHLFRIDISSTEHPG